MAATESAAVSNGGKKTAKKKRAKVKAASAKNGASRAKGAGKRKKGESKSAFIRRHGQMTPLQVEAAAKAAGLKINAAYVSTVRSNDKASGRASSTKRKVGRPKAATPERQFRDLLIHFGVERAAELLEQFRTKLEDLTLS